MEDAVQLQIVAKEKRIARRKRITIDSVLYVLRMADEPQGATLNKLARKRMETKEMHPT